MPADVAVVIPCYNEAPAIARVVRDFREVLPGAAIYVIDNNSTDGSAWLARHAGATVLSERRQGKGYAVQKMFRAVRAGAVAWPANNPKTPSTAKPYTN